MFEIVEIGSATSKSDYQEQLPEIRTQLLQVQAALRDAKVPVMIIVSGVEGAGRGALVSRLGEWMDPRGIQTHAFWNESDEERERPYFWRFWRQLPPRGGIGVFFGSWYSRLIVDRVFDELNDRQFEGRLREVEELERMLSDDGALIVKFWMHLAAPEQQQVFQKDAKKGVHANSMRKRFADHYEEFQRVSARVIRHTDSGHSPWRLVEAADRRYRELTVARHILQVARARLELLSQTPVSAADVVAPEVPATGTVSVLERVDLTKNLDAESYKKKLKKYQKRLHDLAWEAFHQKRSMVALFEGWDAAGKGSAIRRVTNSVDARLYRVIPFAAPTDEEQAHHYLWRFWRQIPRAGYISLYDRSWYGRVLVERVEGFADPAAWHRAYQEINDFESQLHEHGIIIAKFWLHIDADEQLRRFQEREQTPWKQYKITAEDYRNREKWRDYDLAVNDMVAHTSTEAAPWTLVPGNCKKYARVEILKTLCKNLSAALES